MLAQGKAFAQENTKKVPQDARDYYNELRESGSSWNKGNRFNRVCFGEKHDPRTMPDILDGTDTFLLVGFFGESPDTIEVQQYVKGVPETILTFRKDPDGTSWTWRGTVVPMRNQFSISAAGRYHWIITLYDKDGSPLPPTFPYDSYGKCELIR
jgi:hypothetical protein